MSGASKARAVIASGHPRVSEAACEVLRAGGNAFDAAVAAGLASSVAEPGLTSLGGGGFLMARTAEGRAILFDFFVDTPGRGLEGKELEPHFVPMTVHFPGSDQVFNTGLGSAAVPGCLRGYLHVHSRLGRLPLAEVVQPAVELAREGLPLNGPQAYVLDLLEPIMTLTAAGRALYQPEGKYLQEGDRFANPDATAFLEMLAREGDREFYEGEIARRIDSDMREGRGLLTAEDLAAYAVVEREPLAVGYRGLHLLTNPPPSFGGSMVALSLRLLGSARLDRLVFGSAEHLATLVVAMQEADRHRDDACAEDTELSEDGLAESGVRIRRAAGGTTHVSVSDTDGNVASMTTSNGEGSGYLAPGTGVMINNMMGEDDLHPEGFHASPPGLRVASMMAPSLLTDGGRVRLVLGSGGSKRIRTALTQMVSNVVDFGKGVREAVEAPRMHWDGECAQVEPGYEDSALTEIEARWPVNRWPVRDIYFGGVQVVSPDGEGAGDPRRGGHAVVLD